jgi:hypothetical protein
MRAKIAVLLMAFAAAGCSSLLRASTAEVVSLASVGSVSVGSPETNGSVTHIPLALSGGQWQQNSGRVLKEVRVRHFASEIHFSVVTCVATSSPPAMPEIVLEALRPGTYQLFYQNPDATSIRLGIIEIQHAVAADRPKTGAG